MTPNAIKQLLSEMNPDAIIYDDCDDAIIGIGQRCGQNDIAIYSYIKLVHVFAEQMSYEEAIEWIDYNIMGGWLGENTPMIMLDGESIYDE